MELYKYLYNISIYLQICIEVNLCIRYAHTYICFVIINIYLMHLNTLPAIYTYLPFILAYMYSSHT